MRRPIPLAAFVATAVLLAGPIGEVAAQQDEVARAKEHYELGYQALQDGDYQVALAHYQRSFELVPRPRTLFNIAVSEERLGRLEDAHRHYAAFMEIAEDRDQDFKAEARRKLEEIAARLAAEVDIVEDTAPPPRPPERSEPPRVMGLDRCEADSPGILHVTTSITGAAVSVDGLVVGATSIDPQGGAALSRALSPGDHHVIVERAGNPIWQQRIHASPGESIHIDLDVRQPPSTGRKVLTWGLAGLGAIGIATGGTLGVMALRDVASPDLDDHDRGKSRALLSDVLLVGGAVALYGAWRLHRHPETEATVHRTFSNEDGPR